MSTHEALPNLDEVVRQEQGAAFELLAQIVRDNQEAGRRSFGASLKPELRRQTFGGFDEGRLRFVSFRAFLRAAAESGVVDIYDAPKGPDVMLALPGEAPIADAPRVPERHRVRADLWECFVDWDDRYRRTYDVDRDQAFRYPAAAAPLEPPERTELRRVMAEHAERFRVIDAIPFTTQLDWMREFVESVEEPVARVQLQAAMTSARPARAFSQALHGHHQLRSRWSAHRQSLVEAEIRRWAGEAGLQNIEIHELVREESAGESGEDHAPRGGSKANAAEDERLLRMREQIKRAIDRMPASDLERLPIPFGFTFDS